VDKPADFRATKVVEDGLCGVRFCLQWEGEPVEVLLPMIGAHNVLNVLAAMATAHTFGIHPRQAREALAHFQPQKMRGELLEVKGARVLNDCYNSNPCALASMLKTLQKTPAGGRRIAVLGEMLELGPSSPDLHRELGRQAAEAADLLVGVRGHAQHFLEGAAEAGLDASRMAFFETAGEAGSWVASVVQPGDVVLLKGSRGVKLEDALERWREAG
jgi:UDP-N-acetylmuramoyl-tripeptide--D-alanyl-D-alanine ligase